MGKKYLIDSSAAIKYLSEYFPKEALLFIDKIVNEESIISFITRIELLVSSNISFEELKNIKKFIQGSKVINITEAIILETIKIRKEKKLKIPDAIIAATTIVNNLTLIADNDKDFLKVDGLKYLNPNSMKE